RRILRALHLSGNVPACFLSGLRRNQQRNAGTQNETDEKGSECATLTVLDDDIGLVVVQVVIVVVHCYLFFPFDFAGAVPAVFGSFAGTSDLSPFDLRSDAISVRTSSAVIPTIVAA